MLETLILNVGRVVSKEHLAERVWSWGEEPGANAIEVYIHSIHKKLEAAEVATQRTVRGFSYVSTNRTSTSRAHDQGCFPSPHCDANSSSG